MHKRPAICLSLIFSCIPSAYHAYRTYFHILLESSAFILQAVIKNADMAEDMQQDAIDCATQVGMTDVPSLEIGLKAVESCRFADVVNIDARDNVRLWRSTTLRRISQLSSRR